MRNRDRERNRQKYGREREKKAAQKKEDEENRTIIESLYPQRMRSEKVTKEGTRKQTGKQKQWNKIKRKQNEKIDTKQGIKKISVKNIFRFEGREGGRRDNKKI